MMSAPIALISLEAALTGVVGPLGAMSSTPAEALSADTVVAVEPNADRAPLCYIIDGDASIRHFLSLILHGAGFDTEEFAGGRGLSEALSRRHPDLVFLDIPLQSTEAIGSVIALGGCAYRGQLQLMSSRGSAVLQHLRNIAQQQHLTILPPLRKPFETNVIVKLLDDLKLGHPPTVAGRLDIEQALENDWIEFWYQPKIDLRRKQLVGAEAYARARHPTDGILLPAAFMPGASDSSLIALSERALSHSLKAAANFAKLGVMLRMAINVPVNALMKMNVTDIVQSYRPKFEKWPGLVIDVPEEQIVRDLELATELSKKLQHLDVTLAIDEFGRGYSSLAKLKDLPFAEIKIDRAFVTDCGTDKVNAPLCKTVIDLAHNYGSAAVAVGIEKASDALALVSMGCDFGQGFLLGQPMPEDRFISLLRQRTGGPAKPVARAKGSTAEAVRPTA